MIKMQIIPTGSLETNSILVMRDNDAILFDPSGFAQQWTNFIKQNDLNLLGIYITHGHFDHIMAVAELVSVYNIPWFINENDLSIVHGNNDFLPATGHTMIDIPKTPAIPLTAGEQKLLLDIDVDIIETPGHTPGGLCFYIADENILISGDTLFPDTIGRTDLPGGSDNLMKQSIEKLHSKNFDNKTLIIPGHGHMQNFEYMKQNNPYWPKSKN